MGTSITPRISSSGPAYLTVSGQLEAEIMATALGNVYTFGPTFRAENSNTSRHLSEFWMVEPEVAWCDLTRLQDIGEEFIKSIFMAVLENVPEDMRFFNDRIDGSVIETLEHIVASDFVRITYTEAIRPSRAVRRSIRVPGRLGRRPSIGTRALPDREDVQAAGHRHRLSP